MATPAMGKTLSANLELSLHRVALELNSLARANGAESRSWQAAKHAILRTATPLRLETKQTSPPVLLDEIAKLRGIQEIKYLTDPAAPDGVLVPVYSGFRLSVAQRTQLVRQRFSIAHEIGHTFFYDLNANPPGRLLAWGSSGSPTRRKEEDICHAFARELLMPRELVSAEKEASRAESRVGILSDLARSFWVSEEAMTVRLLWDLLEFETCVVLFNHSPNRVRSRAKYPRKYWGKRIARNSLRRKERELPEQVSRAVGEGPPFRALSEIAMSQGSTAELEWKVRQDKDGWSILAFVCFPREPLKKT